MLGSRQLVLALHAAFASGWCSAPRERSAGMEQECWSVGDSEAIPIPARAESLLQLAQFRASTSDLVSQGNSRTSTVYDDAVDLSCKVGKHCATGMPEPRGACVNPGFGQTSNQCWDICNDKHSPEEYLTGDPGFDTEFANAVRHVRSGNYMHLSCDALAHSEAKFDVSGTINEVRKALEAAEEARLVTRAAAIEAKDLVNASKEKRTMAAEVMQEAATAEANALAEARKAMQAIEKLAGQKAEEEAEESEAKAEEAAAKLERQRELEVAAKDAEEAAINATLNTTLNETLNETLNATLNETLKVNVTSEDSESQTVAELKAKGNESVAEGNESEGNETVAELAEGNETVAELKAKLEREEAHAMKAMREETEKAAEAAAAIEAATRAREATKVPDPPNSRPLQVNCTFNESKIEAKAKRAEARQKNVEARVATHEAKKAVVSAKKTLAELEKAKLQAKMMEYEAVLGRVAKLEAELEKAENATARLRDELEAEREVADELAEVLKEAEAAARVAEMQVADAEVEEIAAEAAVEEAAKGVGEMEPNTTLVNQTVVNDTGATAPLNETGIQAVISLQSLAEMEVFIVRVVTKFKLKILNATGLLLESDKLINAVNLMKQNRSFAVLEEDINQTLYWGPRAGAWVGTPIVVDHPEGPDLKKWGRRVAKTAKTAKTASKKDSTKFACYWRASPPCVGEFMYAGASHEGCTTEDSTDGAWCSFDALYVGRWAHCTYVCGEAYGKQKEGFGKHQETISIHIEEPR